MLKNISSQIFFGEGIKKVSIVMTGIHSLILNIFGKTGMHLLSTKRGLNI